MRKMTLNELNSLMHVTIDRGFQPVVLAMNGFEVCRGYICAWEISEPMRQSSLRCFGNEGYYQQQACGKQQIKIEIKTMEGNTCVLYVEEVIDSNDTNQVKELEESFERLNAAVADYKKYFMDDK